MAESKIDQASKSIQRTMIILIAFCLFSIVILRMPDYYLLSEESDIRIPINETPISLNSFLLIGPIILISIFVYLHIFISLRKKLIINGQKDENLTLFNINTCLTKFLSWFVFYALVPLVLLVFYWKAQPISKYSWIYILATLIIFYLYCNSLRPKEKYGKRLQVILFSIISITVFLTLFLHNSRLIYRGLSLNNIDLSKKNLSSIQLYNGSIYNTNFSESDLANASLQYCNLVKSDFNKANLSRANLNYTFMYKDNFVDADLSYAYFIEAHIINVNLTRANLVRANLTRAVLSGVILIETVLIDVDLYRTDLSEAELIGADLSGAILKEAILSRTDLSEADLIVANLSGAILEEAVLSGADLSGADLREVKKLTIDQISKVKSLYLAKLDPELEKQVKEKYPHLLEKPEKEGGESDGE